VPPPETVNPGDKPTDATVFDFKRLGVRVPAVLVSPFIPRGTIIHDKTFDHTSIIRFMERRFGVMEPNISPWRRAICGDLTSAFDFGAVDTGVAALPATTGYQPPDKARHASYIPVPPLNGALPKQESGSRPRRPLPYALSVDASANGSDPYARW